MNVYAHLAGFNSPVKLSHWSTDVALISQKWWCNVRSGVVMLGVVVTSLTCGWLSRQSGVHPVTDVVMTQEVESIRMSLITSGPSCQRQRRTRDDQSALI